MNAGTWARLERAVRHIAATADAVYVFSGPIFEEGEPATIGTGRVAIPSHFFKAVLVVTKSERTMYAAIIPNQPSREPLDHFLASVDDIQQRTGLDFFNRLDPQEQQILESGRPAFPQASEYWVAAPVGLDGKSARAKSAAGRRVIKPRPNAGASARSNPQNET